MILMAHAEVEESLNGVGLLLSTLDKNTLEMLDRKRQQLDREIADFKARKDEEYQRLEQELLEKNAGEKAEGGKDPTIPEPLYQIEHPTEHAEEVRTDPGRTKDSVPVTDRTQVLGGRVASSQEPHEVDSKDVKDMGHGTLILSAQRTSKEQTSRSLTPDREYEFRGLFTPSYLPLLDSTREELKRESEVRPSSPPKQLVGKGFRARDLTTPFSSSATLPPAFYPLHSPSSDRPLSASVPRPRALQERRSSSRSDISITSLRSSLRDPKQPRSPKRVLFAIDNIVVSPSTSPIARRNHAPLPIPFSGLTDMSEATMWKQGRKDGATQHMEFDFQKSTVSPRHASLGSGSSYNLSSPSSISSYRQLLEPTITSSAPVDDFEHVSHEDDALFAFDEDVKLHELEDTGDNKVYPYLGS